MNNINIKNIFANNVINHNSDKNISVNDFSLSDFSVNTLVKSNTFNTSISDDYIIDKIIYNKKYEQTKINELYETKYKECLIKINNSIELNLTDTIFSVGTSFFGFNTYNSTECLKYIQQKLKKKKFLTLIISHKEIFISWKFLTDF